MMTPDQIIEVVQAFKDGKPLQSKQAVSYDPLGQFQQWRDVESSAPLFDFVRCDYRVKAEPPKPREWTLVPSRTESDGERLYCLRPVTDGAYLDGIHVREVIE